MYHALNASFRMSNHVNAYPVTGSLPNGELYPHPTFHPGVFDFFLLGMVSVNIFRRGTGIIALQVRFGFTTRPHPTPNQAPSDPVAFGASDAQNICRNGLLFRGFLQTTGAKSCCSRCTFSPVLVVYLLNDVSWVPIAYGEVVLCSNSGASMTLPRFLQRGHFPSTANCNRLHTLNIHRGILPVGNRDSLVELCNGNRASRPLDPYVPLLAIRTSYPDLTAPTTEKGESLVPVTVYLGRSCVFFQISALLCHASEFGSERLRMFGIFSMLWDAPEGRTMGLTTYCFEDGGQQGHRHQNGTAANSTIADLVPRFISLTLKLDEWRTPEHVRIWGAIKDFFIGPPTILPNATLD
ncbi:hypothetical protein BS47DRAFT_1367179 [Hydnum rufescens UP504]|uniref:Uncharacterized protein n=1 Tax=Hydnum rufescens UP504 TaxID=1448309 RepID=A0A9P6AKY0_9AGAM|nr:hypothetical protein BS47DRAFT_1367179 [Hydnum rufescens UP504]